jgi:DNA-binding transcriptional regulator YdaS (Cro superfamily)
MSKKSQPAVIAFACEKAGNAAALARQLGISKQAISQWTEIPIRHVHRVNEVTGIPLTDLRPDVFRGAAQ